MWIRSQDKRFLVDIDIAFVTERQIVGITSYAICYHKEIDIDLGVYSAYEKALKVLNKIENFIYANDFFEKGFGSNFVMNNVFHMPEDSEVEDDE